MKNIERVVPGQRRKGMKNLVTLSLSKYRFASKYCQNKIVLDLGCGSGHGSNFIKKSGATMVFGVDKSQEAISFAKKNYLSPNVKFQLMDAQKLKFEKNSFDTVVSFEVIEHVKDINKYLKGIGRVLKDGGVYILSTPNKEAIFGGTPNPYHVHEFDYNEFKNTLNKHFRIVRVYGLSVTHPKSRSYERVSKKLELISKISNKFPIISAHILKSIKNLVFKSLTPKIPELTFSDIEISEKDIYRKRVLIAVCKGVRVQRFLHKDGRVSN